MTEGLSRAQVFLFSSYFHSVFGEFDECVLDAVQYDPIASQNTCGLFEDNVIWDYDAPIQSMTKLGQAKDKQT